MSFEDIPDVPMPPLPLSYEAFCRPVIITKEYYEKLPEHEKIHYEQFNKNGGNKVGNAKSKVKEI